MLDSSQNKNESNGSCAIVTHADTTRHTHRKYSRTFILHGKIRESFITKNDEAPPHGLAINIGHIIVIDAFTQTQKFNSLLEWTTHRKAEANSMHAYFPLTVAVATQPLFVKVSEKKIYFACRIIDEFFSRCAINLHFPNRLNYYYNLLKSCWCVRTEWMCRIYIIAVVGIVSLKYIINVCKIKSISMKTNLFGDNDDVDIALSNSIFSVGSSSIQT